MKVEEFKAITQKIIESATDQAVLTSLLTELTEDCIKENATLIEVSQKAENLLKDNENLRKTNMDLFLKVGSTIENKKEGNKLEDNTPKFEDLFKDGNLL